MLDIIFTTALVPYWEKERMNVYKHTQLQLQWSVGNEFQRKKQMCTSPEKYCTR